MQDTLCLVAPYLFRLEPLAFRSVDWFWYDWWWWCLVCTTSTVFFVQPVPYWTDGRQGLSCGSFAGVLQHIWTNLSHPRQLQTVGQAAGFLRSTSGCGAMGERSPERSQLRMLRRCGGSVSRMQDGRGLKPSSAEDWRHWQGRRNKFLVRTYTISYTISYTLLYRIRYRIFVYDIVYLYDIVYDMQWDIVYDIAYDIVYDIAFIVISSGGLQICMSVFLITAFAIVFKLPLQSTFFGVLHMNLCHCTCRLDTCWRTTETLNSPRFMTTLVDRLSLQPHMSPFYQLYTHREAHKGQGHSTFHGVCAMALAKTSSLSPVDIRGRAPYCTQNATVRLTYTHGGSLHSSLVLRPPNWRVTIPIFYVKNVRVSHPSALVTRPKRGCRL